MTASTLAVFVARLDGAPSNLVLWKGVPARGRAAGTLMVIEVHSNRNHSMKY